MTKTPRLTMVEAIRRFAALFPKLPVQAGGLLCLAEERAVFSKDLRVQPLADYWQWLRADA